MALGTQKPHEITWLTCDHTSQSCHPTTPMLVGPNYMVEVLPIAPGILTKAPVGKHPKSLGGHDSFLGSCGHHVTIAQPRITRAPSSVGPWNSGPRP